ncbi:MAG TPA: AMP-binding protein [Ktedonobacterales bacterium]
MNTLTVPRSHAVAHARTNEQSHARRYELDWLRAGVVLGLIPVHAAVIYSTTADIYLKSAQRSEIMALVGAFAGAWGMPLLFLVAGAAAWFALGVRGPKRFLGERATRLLIPFVFATLMIIPMQVFIVLAANPTLLHQYNIPVTNPHMTDSYLRFYPLYLGAYGYFLTHFSPWLVPIFWGHLWFIPRLFAYSVVALPLFLYLRGAHGQRALGWLAARSDVPGFVLLFSVPLVLANMLLGSGWLTRLTSSWPIYDDWDQFVFFLIFFVYGYILYADARFGAAVEREGLVALALGIVLFVIGAMLSMPAINAPFNTWLGNVSFVPLRGFIAWFWVVAVLALGRRYLSFTHPVQHYLTEAAYPVYVLHLPVLTLLAVTMLHWRLNMVTQFTVLIIITLAVTLAIYDLVIKRTHVTRFLFGMKVSPSSSSGGEIGGVSSATIQAGGKAVGMETASREASTSQMPQSTLSEVWSPPLDASDPLAPGPERNVAQLFRTRSKDYDESVAWRQKRDERWVSATWGENKRLVNRLIVGLDELGACQGDRIGILSNTCWEWMAADWAILGLGAITVTIYPSLTPSTIARLLNDSGARYLFVEDREQYERLIGIRSSIPCVQKLILFEGGKTLEHDSWVMGFDELEDMSNGTPEEADAFAAARAEMLTPDDVATIVYTSGTTGIPKGVVLTHRNLLTSVWNARAMLPILHRGMVDLLWLPLSHVLGRQQHLLCYERGIETVVVQSWAHLADDIREAQPHLLLGAPRMYEKAYATITARVDASSAIERMIFKMAVRVGRRVAAYRDEQRPIPLFLRWPYALAGRLVFRQIRDALGGRLELAVSGGAPLDRDILAFFHAAGILLLEGWGLTETMSAFTINRSDHYRLGTVGQVCPGHALRAANDGELLVRGPCVFTGYYNMPEETREAIDADGWFHTGDIGTVGADGFVRIVDRKKDLIATSGGKKIAPQAVENVLQSIPVVSQAAVFGDRKPYLVALLTLDPESVRKWARGAGIASDAIEEIMNDKRFSAHLAAEVTRVNAQLAHYETVKHYSIVHDDFTVENGLLTPSLKIRRREIGRVYHDTIEAMYKTAPDVNPPQQGAA